MEIRPLSASPRPAVPGAPTWTARVSDRFEPSTPGPDLIPRPDPRVPTNAGLPPEEVRRAVEALLVPSTASPEAREMLARDVATLPLSLLKSLGEDGVKVVMLAPGQSLADTPLLRPTEPAVQAARMDRAREVLDRVTAVEQRVTEEELAGPDGADPLKAGMARYREARRIAEALGPALEAAGLDFTVRRITEPDDLDRLAEDQGVPPDRREDWEEALRVLNGGHLDLDFGMARPRHGVFLLPYTYHRGSLVRREVLESLKRYDSAYVERSLGLHLPEERLVILHQDYVTDPSPQLGHYRVALHELGHAVDHALDRRLGAGHRDRVERLFREDRQALEAGGPNRFLTPRAMDNDREYFAEAVEAWLTVPVDDGQDTFRTGGNRENLRRLRPELHALVGELFGAPQA